MLYIHDGKVQQMLLFASLWDGKGYTVHVHIQLKRYDDFARFAFVSFPHFNDAQLKQFFLGFVQSFLVFESKGLVNASVRNMKVVYVC